MKIKELDMSGRHLGRVFKAETGQTLNKYFQQRRIQRVQRLLLEPGHTLTQIAHLAGFSDAAHMCHQFKAQTQITASSYRKRYLAPQHPPTAHNL